MSPINLHRQSCRGHGHDAKQFARFALRPSERTNFVYSISKHLSCNCTGTLLHQTQLDCFTKSCICGRQPMIAVLAADDLKVEVGLTAQQHRPKDAPVYSPYCTGPGSFVTPQLIIRQDAGIGAHTCDGLGQHQSRREECYFRFRKDSLLFLAGSPLSPPLSSQSRTTIDKALFKTSDAR